MIGKNYCKVCNQEFDWERTKKQIEERGEPKFCSQSCRAKFYQQKNVFFWDSLNREEKIERLKKSFYLKFKEKNSCWEWIGAVQSGYGSIRYDKKHIGAHRASWIIHRGEIAKNLCVCHKCDNPKCVNPDHLFIGTYKENSEDREKKGRGAKGAKCAKTKLNESLVKKIRKMLKMKITGREIARKFKVSSSTIYTIKSNKFWKWVK